MTIKVEICVDTPDGLAAAIAGGADRIELCSALALGGLTPSPGLMRLAGKAPVPVYAMIRPREGDFVFSPAEIDQMRREIDAARVAGLAGVVLGASEPRGRLDSEVLFRLVGHAEALGTTLHRAFDLVPDPNEALETAVALGFERILTSGQASRAVDALPRLAELVKKAGARISIMPGSGIRPGNAEQVLRETGAHEIHASCRTATIDVAPEAVHLGFAPAAVLPATSEQSVSELVATVRMFEFVRG
ncbi:copper homeostasis protein CutC [Kaistia dalseonensis]|uniref:PF03932 family protein CutC n=1 Tax=Kaistia dalseonensis TaxID=410840 RepID=A0ABU0HBY6_9HYPH|nr:copper homeostasis protein CutC [Kaistia dalseonensis]MCX5497192.1 copper homeostasis protein CutC [Kaistia dalseonensis]MDQ0439823.1 copper homeostasis protein [Kaistia dalseonensis]